MTTRRTFLKSSTLTLTLGLAGCTTQQPDNEDPQPTKTYKINTANPNPVEDQTFQTWEPETNCNDGEMESMYNSEISVAEIKDKLSNEYNPIKYTDLPEEEQRILATVLEKGGYATCETSDAFNAFLDTAVNEHARKQEGDDMHAYLEYDGRYYQLYLRKQDQVYAY